MVIWTYFEVIITYFYLKDICFILYKKHINNHYQICLIMMTDVAVAEEKISHSTLVLVDNFTSESTNIITIIRVIGTFNCLVL